MTRRLAPSAWAALAIGTLLVGVGVWMIVAGMPERTPQQSLLLELSALPLSAAVAVAIAQMAFERRLLRRRGLPRWILLGAAALVGSGLVAYVVAFTAGPRAVSSFGQALIWVGLGVAFCYLAADSIRRERVISRVVPLDERPDDDA